MIGDIHIKENYNNVTNNIFILHLMIIGILKENIKY